MIHFYTLGFFGFAIIVVNIIFVTMRRSTPRNRAAWFGITSGIALAMLIVAAFGADKHKGYTYFDPAICAQMVYDEDSRKWVCITWEEAG